MQTILGSTGAIGTELASVLPRFTDDIRLVSRNPQPVSGHEQLASANLLQAEDADRAIAGSDIVYMTVGLPYRVEVWQRDWPVLIGNVIEACEKHSAKLVFFDNVYPYGIVDGWMTEETPIQPASEKGVARAKVDSMILEAVEQGRIKATLARAADFYGQTPLAWFHLLIIERLVNGKRPQYMINPKYRHSFTHIRDAAEGTALLGNTPDTFNQTWHLPTDMNVLTGKEWVRIAAEEIGGNPNPMSIPKWMMQLMGLFSPDMKNIAEMLYQNERDYLFDCSKFYDRFNYRAMTPHEGICYTLDKMKSLPLPKQRA